MRRLFLSLAVVSITSVAFPASAASFLTSSDELALTVPVQDDVYAFGSVIVAEDSIHGDLIAAGGDLTVLGDVASDVSLAGGTVVVKGTVGDDVRVVGGNIRIEGTVNGDLLVAGGRVIIEEDALIKGDVILAGGDISINGTVRGNLRVNGGRFALRGTVQGTCDINADDARIDGTVRSAAAISAKTLRLGSDATFGSKVSYWLPDGEMDFGTAVQSGMVSFDPSLRKWEVPPSVTEEARTGLKVAFAAAVGYNLLSAAFLMFLLLLVTRTFFPDTAKRLVKAPGKSLATGLLFFVLTPVVSFLFFLTVIGIPVGAFLIALYAFMLYFARTLAAIVLAYWLADRYRWKRGKVAMFFTSIVFYVLLKLLGYIPLLGWVGMLILVCMVFGALLHTRLLLLKKLL